MNASTKLANTGVFISHRTADADAARLLAEELRREGYKVWLDEWEIRIGDSIVERINAGLQDVKYVVICYSEAGVLSKWMSREWMSALTRQLEGHDIKLLPVLLSGRAIPAILADIRYADLVSDWDKGVKDLLKAMN
jgi:hypothetical protein